MNQQYDIDLNKLSRDVKARMESERLSLRMAAEQFGFDHVSLSRVVNSKMLPNRSNFLRLCNWLGKSPEVYLDAPAHLLRIPLYLTRVNAGKPAPAESDIEDELEFSASLLRHRTDLFGVRVAGDSMIGAGILDGDLLIVKRTPEALNKQIVVANVNNEFCVKRLLLKRERAVFHSENPRYPDIAQRHEGDEATIWGQVVHLHRDFKL